MLLSSIRELSVAGENAQFQPLGRPAQESDTGLLNEPDCGFAVTISFPVLPAGIMTDVGDALRVKVGGDPRLRYMRECRRCFR